MIADRAPWMTGGCQCGAVRYALLAPPYDPHLCHCRMCQKATGSAFAVLAGVAWADFAVTRGSIAEFASSDIGRRGFCRDCGTPLTYHRVGGDGVGVTVGSMDRPERVAPTEQHGVEAMLAWAATLPGLPARVSADAPGLASRQHPDRDTESWPPAAKR
ncbi:MAG: GFA family protein [Alphaproteobacteria bacterium]